ncbi:single-strand selective monofunctional uracil DNA glycosylase isoform X2 [Zootermopsis nevadensis]|uniref:single-strand selective monofunctional uracil DNA glycosylase isoform X2 n=1 Tax=Zootermopsis nevadensis TaxID=136037 RepID=UPI000B8E76EC|nr:single-strand selective monofunctional uracil DNA glycosylase isoform X2 [Zootermopsis nevadensis]
MANATEGSDSVAHRLLTTELLQSVRLNALLFCDPVEYIYNPLEYAYDVHSDFVHKFCTSTKKILFLGMNPGPWGMSQTGVPFGEVKIVREWLRISGHVGRPQKEHPSRQVLGLECKRSEVSGRKFWGLFQKLCGDPDTFFQHAFVYNYCPLAFMTNSGKNITPAELKIGSIPHPSPRNFSSKNWPEETIKRLQELDILTMLSSNTNIVPMKQTW